MEFFRMVVFVSSWKYGKFVRRNRLCLGHKSPVFVVGKIRSRAALVRV